MLQCLPISTYESEHWKEQHVATNNRAGTDNSQCQPDLQKSPLKSSHAVLLFPSHWGRDVLLIM